MTSYSSDRVTLILECLAGLSFVPLLIAISPFLCCWWLLLECIKDEESEYIESAKSLYIDQLEQNLRSLKHERSVYTYNIHNVRPCHVKYIEVIIREMNYRRTIQQTLPRFINQVRGGPKIFIYVDPLGCSYLYREVCNGS